MRATVEWAQARVTVVSDRSRVARCWPRPDDDRRGAFGDVEVTVR